MSDYISRQWLLNEYDKRHKGPPGGARKMIEEAPAADVRPVVMAENIGTVAECDQLICSKCGIILEGWVRVEIDEDDGEVTHHEYVMHFCPNCGAKMGGTP